MDRDRGFTLVELLVVIAILGLIAAVAVLGVTNLTGSTRENSCGVERQTLRTAAVTYLTADTTTTVIPGGSSAERHQTLVDAEYLKETAHDKFDLAADGTVEVVEGGPCDLAE